MPKNIYYIMIGLGIVGGLILYFQNTIFNYTLYSPFGPKASSLIILYSLGLGFVAGFGLGGVFHGKKDEEYDDEHF